MNASEKLYIDDIEVYVMPKIGMNVLFKDDHSSNTGIICNVQDNGKTVLFKDKNGEIHMAKLSTRKNSAVKRTMDRKWRYWKIRKFI